MAQVYLGSLMLVPYTFAPTGWALCQGQLMQIRSNTALFSLLGTYYGGDGVTTFGLPNLQGAVPVAQGQGPGLSPYDLGQSGGTTSVTLLSGQVPPHNHSMLATSSPASSASPANTAFAEAPIFTTDTGHVVQMNQTAIQPVGGSQPHNNMMPYQVLNWIIALQGIFPPRQ